MMTRPREQRLLWTPEKDNKLKEFKLKNPDRSWPGTAELAELDRTDKSCWERWNNHPKPGVNKENFSQEEDDIIIRIQQMPDHRNKWAFMAKFHLPGRSRSAIKNHWNNYLAKLLKDDEPSDHHSVWGDDLEASAPDSADLIPNLDPNAIRSIMDTYNS